MRVRVHPDFLGRGIGTLLLRLAEHRARQYVKQAPSGLRVVLHSAVSAINQEAKELLEQEGYTPVSRFWRMMIDADESADGSYQQGKLKFDLFLEAQQLAGIAQEQQRTGIYVARQYDVFEKGLRLCYAISNPLRDALRRIPRSGTISIGTHQIERTHEYEYTSIPNPYTIV